MDSRLRIELPLFSIIMPVYNCAPWVGQAIRSVQSQTLDKWELIVVDDESTDESLDIIKSFALMDPRIAAVAKKHTGTASIPRNEGIRKATGKYIAFLDADDLYHHKRLELVYQFFERHPEVDVVFSDVTRISESSHKPVGRTTRFEDVLNVWPRGRYWDSDTGKPWISGKEAFHLCIIYSLPAQTGSISIRKECLWSEKRWFNPSMIIGEDRELWLRLMHKNKSAFLPNILSYYRKRTGSLTQESHIRCIKSDVAFNGMIRDRYASELSSSEYRALIKIHAKALFTLGWNLWRAGCASEARKYYRKSFEMNKSLLTLKAIAKTFVPYYLAKMGLNMFGSKNERSK